MAAHDVRRESPWTLVDLVGSETIQAVQDAFATAFDLPTVVLDHEGHNVNEITNRVRFCEDLTRPSSAGAKCLACDVAAMRRSEVTRKPTIFPCWNGLYDCTIPIISGDGEVFGHFLSGQVIDRPPAEFGRWQQVAREHGIDENDYVDALREVRVLPLDVYRHRIECMAILARMIADQASLALQHRVMLEQALDARAATEQLSAELDAITRASAASAEIADLHETLTRLADAARRVIPHESLVIYMAEPTGGRLDPVVVRDPFAAALSTWRPTMGEGIVGVAAAECVSSRLDAATDHAAYQPIPGVPEEPEAMLVVPIANEGVAVGVIVLSRFKGTTFTEHELDLLRIISVQAANAIRISVLRAEADRARRLHAIERATHGRIASGARPSEVIGWLLEQAQQLLSADQVILAHGRRPAIASPPVDPSRWPPRPLVDPIERALATGRVTSAIHRRREVIVAPSGTDEAAYLVVSRLTQLSLAERECALSLAGIGARLLVIEEDRARAMRFAARTGSFVALSERLASARTSEEVVRVLLEAHTLVDGVRTGVVTRTALSSMLRWHVKGATGVEEELIVASGRPRLQLPDPSDDPSVSSRWGAWAAAVTGASSRGSRWTEPTAVPFANGGMTGAVIIDQSHAITSDERGLLQSLARMAARHLDRRSLDGGRATRDEEVQTLLDVLAMTRPESERTVAEQVLRTFAAIADVPAAVLERPDGAVLATLGGSPRRGWPAVLSFDSGVVRSSQPMPDTRLEAFPRLGQLAAELLKRAAEHQVFAARMVDALSDIDGLSTRLAASERMNAEMQAIAGSFAESGRLQDLVTHLHHVTGNGVELVDEDGRQIAAAGLDHDPDRDDPRRFAIRTGTEPLGELRAYTADASPVVALAGALASVVLGAGRCVRGLEARLDGEVVSALIDSERSSADLVRRAGSVGLELGAGMRVAVVLLGHIPDAQAEHAVASSVRWARTERVRVLVTHRERAIVAVGPAHADWAEGLYNALRAEAVSDIYVGIGCEATEVSGYRDSYLGGKAASLAMEAAGRPGVLIAGDDSIESVLLQSADPARLVAFAGRILQPLQQYDVQRHAALERTIGALVDHGWNLHAAARASHIHVSTLRYRLRRVEELTGLALSRPDDRLALQLALMTTRLLDIRTDDP